MAGIVAIGASHGGVHALRILVGGLPRDFPEPIVVVQHVGAARSILPSLLTDQGGIQASHARDREPLHSGHIHIAPPDHHLLLEDGHLRLSRGPRENWARPAIDPLFRSVAQTFGTGAIGVILSGSLNDGTAGLYEIKRHGGTAIVQDPDEAEAPSMPRSALENVAVDYRVRIGELAALLVTLAQQSRKQRTGEAGVRIMPHLDYTFSTPLAQTCPECGGAMREEQLGTIRQFRCHIGHLQTAEVFAAAKLERLENDLSVCVRAANERAELCKEIARKHEAHGSAAVARRWQKAAAQAEERARMLADVAGKEWFDSESVEPEQPATRP